MKTYEITYTNSGLWGSITLWLLGPLYWYETAYNEADARNQFKKIYGTAYKIVGLREFTGALNQAKKYPPLV